MLPAVIMILFYFMLLRPQQKQAREAQNFRDALKAGDQVITAGGIYGKVAEVAADYVMLEVASKTRIKVLRGQISMAQSALDKSDEGDKDEDKDKDE